MLASDPQTEADFFNLIKTNWNDNDDTIMPPLFHGTDASLISASKHERARLNAACEIIINAILELYDANSISLYDKRLYESRDSYGSTASALVHANGRIHNSPLYSYGDFYVTNDPYRAEGYSREAWICGETGWTANRLVEGSIALGLELPNDEDFKSAIELFNMRKQRIKEPIIIMLVNYSSSLLYTEAGGNITDWDVSAIKSSPPCTMSFRLNAQISRNGQTTYQIEKEYFPNLLKAWDTIWENDI